MGGDDLDKHVQITVTIKSRLLFTQKPSNAFSLLTLMQLQALNWLNIAQMSLF